MKCLRFPGWVCLCCACVVVIGCASAPRARTAVQEQNVKRETLMRGLAQVSWSDGRSEYASLAAVLAQAPDQLRIELIDPAIGTWAVVGASGKSAWVWSADEQRVRRGSAKRALKKLIGFDETTEQVVTKLLQLRPADMNVLRIASGDGWLMFEFEEIQFGGDVDVQLFSAESMQR